MKLFVKYMVSGECRDVVKKKLEKLGLEYKGVELSEVEVKKNITAVQRKKLKEELLLSGYELLDDKNSRLIEKIKAAIIEIIHHQDEMPKIKNSVFLAEKLNYDYTYMANVFSDTFGTTIEQYIISQKIERVKELLLFDDLNLTEISYKLNYCNVAHLSQQFKKVTGLTPTIFRQMKQNSPVTL
jgi:AraC-like DNA-binding protein